MNIYWRILCAVSLLISFIPNVLVAEAIPVTVKHLSEIVIYPTNDAPATVLSLNESTLSSEISGRIISLPKLVGESVEQGEILAEVDCINYELELNRAKADISGIQSELKLTEWQLSRTRKLALANNATEEGVKKLEATLSGLKSQLKRQQTLIEQAQTTTERCQIKAPFSGIINKRLIHLGELATPGSPVIHLVDTENLEVEATFHGKESSEITQAHVLRLEAKNQSYPLTLRTVVPTLDNRSRTQKARFTFNHQPALPGTAGRLVWSSDSPHLPSSYIRQMGPVLGFFVAKGEIAQFIPLHHAIEGQPALVENLGNPLVIIDGRYAVREGSTISIAKR